MSSAQITDLLADKLDSIFIVTLRTQLLLDIASPKSYWHPHRGYPGHQRLSISACFVI